MLTQSGHPPELPGMPQESVFEPDTGSAACETQTSIPPTTAEPMLSLPLHPNLPTGLFLLPMNELPLPEQNRDAGGLLLSHNFCFWPSAGGLVVCTTWFLRLSCRQSVWLGKWTPRTRLAFSSPPRGRGEPRGSADDNFWGPSLTDGSCLLLSPSPASLFPSCCPGCRGCRFRPRA